MAIADVSIGIRTVNHWIGGQADRFRIRAAPAMVWNPATGEAQAKVDFASAEEVDHAVASRQASLPGMARHAALPPRRSHVQAARAGGCQSPPASPN